MHHGVDWSRLPAPLPGLRCVVVMPARDERLLLPGALRALAGQCLPGGAAPRTVFEVIVLANNCSDDTAASARRVAATQPQATVHVVEASFPAAQANVGHARRLLLDEAARRLARADARDGVIASTDADTRVAPDWLAATLAAVDAGADAVGGRIGLLAGTAPPAATLRVQRLDDCYRLLRATAESAVDPDPGDPWPRHHQHFGASLAVRVDAYRAVGGQPCVPYLEDEALVRALRRADRTVRHCPAVRVRTSGRFDGRAPVGLAWQLRDWDDRVREARQPEVADPVRELRAWGLRRALRELWRSHASLDRAVLADRLCALDLVAEREIPALVAAKFFGSFWETFEQRQGFAGAGHAVPLDAALHTLRRFVAAQRRPLNSPAAVP